MSRYRFRLAQVLRIREVQADLAAATVSAAQRAEGHAVAAEAHRLAAIAHRSRPVGRQPVGRLRVDRSIWDAELESLAARSADTSAARAETAERRTAWSAAARRVRALELLDERRRAEHRAHLDRIEALRVDDLVASRHRRSRGAPR